MATPFIAFYSKRPALASLALIISGLSAWRSLATFQARVWPEMTGLFWGLALAVGFGLFWIAAFYLIDRLKSRLSGPGRFTALLGAALFGLAALLLTTPAGLARITLELQAEDVWSPHIFTAAWAGDGLWEAPLTLPTARPVPATLEIVAGGQNSLAGGSEVWLVGAAWPDGSAIPFNQFQTDGGWQLQQIEWDSDRTRPVWISAAAQPAALRWSGPAPGPLTLTFARHNRAGQVAVHWNGEPARSLDLYAPDAALTGLTLPAGQPAIWRANLPVSALNQDVSFSIEPDPLEGVAAVIKKVSLVGLPGQRVELAGQQLAGALHPETAQTRLTPTGLRFAPDEAGEPVRAFLDDSVIAASGWAIILPWLENLLLILHLAVIGGIVLAALAGSIRPQALTGLNLAAASLIVTLVLGELGLRLYLPPADNYYVWPPRLHKVFRPSAAALPGISGETHFIINAQGIRGDEFSPRHDYKILAVGGSTTESLFLDQTEAWPQLLQDKLNNNDSGLNAWVGNVGKAGRNTREHIVQLKHLLPQYPDLDAVLLLVGVNDLVLRLELGDRYTPRYQTVPGMKQALIERAFDVFPRQDPHLQPYYRQTATARLLNRIQQARQPPAAAEIEIQNEDGSNVIRRREERQKAVIQERLSDLSAALDEYNRNINTLLDLAEAHHVRPILMTQPVLWRANLTPAEKELLWLGWGPENEFYYAAEALAEGMAAYNETLLAICDRRQVECIDLAAALPRDTTIFYDDVHFNENGSRQVAAVLADYLLGQFPFGPDGAEPASKK